MARKPPQRFTVPLRDRFLKNVREGMRRGPAADEIGLPRILVRDFIAGNPDFERLVLDAETDANELVEEALFQAAISGNVSAARAWMELRGGGIRHPSWSELGTQPPQPPLRGSEPPSDAFEDLDNVQVLDPRKRRENG